MTDSLGPQFKPPSGQPQQGTLFPQPKPTAEHRWPKGYSPERRDEMGNWLEVSGAQRAAAGVTTQAHHINDAILRSTAPVSPNAANGDNLLIMKVGGTDKTASGRYLPGGSMAHVYSGSNTGGRIDDEMTALHELGHHYSYAAGTEHSNSNRYTPERRGREEAFADDFMTQHYVPRRQDVGKPDADPAKHTSYTDPATWTRDYTSEPWQSHNAYMGARTTLPDRSAAEARRPPSQPHLFQRTANAVNTETERDYGQWGLLADDGKTPIDTITLGRGVPPREERMKPGLPRELTPDVIDENRGVPDYKSLGERHGMTSMEAYSRYGEGGYGGVENAVADWKAGKLRP